MKSERGLIKTLFLWWAIGHLGCVGTIVVLVLVVAAAAVMAVLLVRVLEVLVALGALFGAAITLRNYGLAFCHNVRRERVL